MNLNRLSSITVLVGGLILAIPAVADTEFACSANSGTNCQGTIPDFPISTPFASSFTVPATAVACAGGVAGLGVKVNLVHDNVGDLTITAAGPAGTATLISQPPGAFGSCAGDDILATFTNQGSPGAPNSCTDAGIPAITGARLPVSGGAALNITNPAGLWTLTVTDNSNGFEGFVQDWSVVAICPPLVVPTQSPIGLLVLVLVLATLGALGLGVARRRR